MSEDKSKKTGGGGLSLAPLSFEEALSSLLQVKPDEDKQKGRRGKRKPQKEQEKQEQGD